MTSITVHWEGTTKETEYIKWIQNSEEKTFFPFCIVSRLSSKKIKHLRITSERVRINPLFFMYANIIDFADVTIHGRVHAIWNGVTIRIHSQWAAAFVRFHKLSTFSNVTLRRGLCIYVQKLCKHKNEWMNIWAHFVLAHAAIQANIRTLSPSLSLRVLCACARVCLRSDKLTYSFQGFLSLLYAIPF